MEVRSRPATAADLADLADLAQRAIAELTPHRGGELWRREAGRAVPVEESLTADLADRDVAIVAGCIDDVVVGYGVVRIVTLRDGSLLARVTDLFTQAEARAVGVGEAMMNDLVAEAERRACIGVDSMALPGDRETKNFFESFGLVARAITVHRRLGP